MAERDPRAKNAKPEQFIDGAILREIEKSGFVTRLYHRNKQDIFCVSKIEARALSLTGKGKFLFQTGERVTRGRQPRPEVPASRQRLHTQR